MSKPVSKTSNPSSSLNSSLSTAPGSLTELGDVKDKISEIKYSWIVRFKPGTTQTVIDRHIQTVTELNRSKDYMLDGKQFVGVRGVLTHLKMGYVGVFHPKLIEKIGGMDEVLVTILDAPLQSHATYPKLQTKKWWLAKLSDPSFKAKVGELADCYESPESGAGVDLWILEGGIGFYADNAGEELYNAQAGHALGRQVDRVLVPNPVRVIPPGATETRIIAIDHPTAVAIFAGGSTNGVAKRSTLRLFPNGMTGNILTEQAISSALLAIQLILLFRSEQRDRLAQGQLNHIPHCVVNCSWGTQKTESNKQYHIAIDTLGDAFGQLEDDGVYIVVSAGNDGLKVDSSIFPAYLPNVITVGSIGINDDISSFSNFGDAVDIYAPGENLPNPGLPADSLKRWDGTSFASPMVAGILACQLGKYGYAKATPTFQQVKDMLVNECSREVTRKDPIFGSKLDVSKKKYRVACSNKDATW